MTMPKKVTLETYVAIKVNTGNFETIDVTKTIRTDVEFEEMKELEKKSVALDAVVIKLAKEEAEAALRETGRSRYVKTGNTESKVDTWCDPKAPAQSNI